MTKQISKHASEQIPRALLVEELEKELNSFKQRNFQLINSKKIHCQDCLKAHALAIAKALGLKINPGIMKGNLGHNGYYLDEDDLIRVA